MTAPHILVVDDERDIRSLLKEILLDEGYEVDTAKDAAEAREARRQHRPDLILLDIWMPDIDGITLLKEWTEEDTLSSPVIMMSGHGNVETAVEATRLGAYDFIEKPLTMAKLLLTIRRALEASALKRENIGLRSKTYQLDEPGGSSQRICSLKEQIQRIAAHKTAVFMRGESGTGKESYARYLHNCSPRASGPFVAVNVASLARENPAVALFGQEDSDNVYFGFIEQANGGTLLLKDIADLDMSIQARLLNVLESQSLTRVDGREPIAIDVRVIAATRQDLQEEVSAGRFRDDLYYHLNVLPLEIPPLRALKEDIPEFTERFLAHLVEREGLPRRSINPAALAQLKRYDWPGNMRELNNLIQRLLIMGNNDEIQASEIESSLGISYQSTETELMPGFELPLREARDMFEKAYLEYQLGKTGGNVTDVSKIAGMERTHLYRKLRALGIDPKQMKH